MYHIEEEASCVKGCRRSGVDFVKVCVINVHEIIAPSVVKINGKILR